MYTFQNDFSTLLRKHHSSFAGMESEEAQELRNINVSRHETLCSMPSGRERLLPILANQPYRGKNGVFRAIFAKQDQLFALVRTDARVRVVWERTVSRFDWHPRNESRYHNSLLDFLRSNTIGLFRQRSRSGLRRGDSLRSASGAARHTRQRDAHHHENGHRQPRLGPSQDTFERSSRTFPNEQRAKPSFTAAKDDLSSRKANPTTVSKAQSQSSTLEGDPDAMRNGFERFRDACHRMRLANNGAVPKEWDTRAALNECYINAHLELGKDPPWALVEAAHVKRQTVSFGLAGARMVDVEQVKKDASEVLLPLHGIPNKGTTQHARSAAQAADHFSGTSNAENSGAIAAGTLRKQ